MRPSASRAPNSVLRAASAMAQAMDRVATGGDQTVPFQTGSLRIARTATLRDACADRLLDARIRIAISVTPPKSRVSVR